MSRETTVAKHYHLDDSELPWVYVRTTDAGGIFGIRKDSLLSAFNPHLTSVAYAPHSYRVMHAPGIISGPTDVEYVESYGDGTSHGTTWHHFAEALKSLDFRSFSQLDDIQLGLHLDGLENMALEGARRHGAGWDVIYEGLTDAREDLEDGKRYRQGPLYHGLGWLATNFAEREAVALHSVAS